METDNTLEAYLLRRGIDLKHAPVDITMDDATLSEVASAWNDYAETIRLVLHTRMEKLRNSLIFDCDPREVVIKRECLVELSNILTDFERYHAEYQKRVPNNTLPGQTDTGASV